MCQLLMFSPLVLATLEAETKEGALRKMAQIPIGTIFAWMMAIAFVVSIASTVAVKIYKIIKKYNDAKEENDLLKKKIIIHDEKIDNLDKKIDKILHALDKQDKEELSRLRHSIVRAGEEYVKQGSITIRQLRSLEELFDEYHNERKANGYVTTLMMKVRSLTVVGKLDENDCDIDEEE